MNDELFTSEQWCHRLGILRGDILDPDGWDRKNLYHSWWIEKITKDEFMCRYYLSTIKGGKNAKAT